MGAKLGFYLFKSYPRIFSVSEYWNKNPNKNYHIYNPYLKFLWQKPEIPVTIINTEDYKELHKEKWNIVLTHLYLPEDLYQIKNLIPYDNVKIIKIIYDKDQISEIVTRFYTVTDRTENEEYLINLLEKQIDKGFGEALRIPYSWLKNNEILDLSQVIQYINRN